MISLVDLMTAPTVELIRRGFQMPDGLSMLEEIKNDPFVSVIAEFKRRSPSMTGPAHDDDIEDVLIEYMNGGATGLSILTEPLLFGGSPDDLIEARQFSHLPIMRKDFLQTSRDVIQSKLLGADCVLLIAGFLDQPTLTHMLKICKNQNMDALVEVYSDYDLDIARRAGAEMIGVNCRNLRTMQVDFDHHEIMVDKIPSDIIKVALSGQDGSYSRIDKVRDLGYDAVLVGSALMASNDRQSEVRRYAGRRKLRDL